MLCMLVNKRWLANMSPQLGRVAQINPARLGLQPPFAIFLPVKNNQNQFHMKTTKILIIPFLTCALLLPQILLGSDANKSKKKSDNDFTNNISPIVCVTSVIKGSPAELVGIKTGDTLIQIGGKTLTNSVDAVELIKNAGLNFSVVVGDKSGQRTLAIKRNEGERLGIALLDQLPSGQIPFGYVLKWFDGIVLDIFHGKLKQAEAVLNPYDLKIETASSLKTKDGDAIDGGTIPCGGKFVYVDSQGRQFKVVNELIELPDGNLSLDVLQKSPQWSLLKLQPFNAVLATQANEQQAQSAEQAKTQAETTSKQLANSSAVLSVGDLDNAKEKTKKMKEDGKFVFKNLYTGMPAKDALVVLKSLLGIEFFIVKAEDSGGGGYLISANPDYGFSVYHNEVVVGKADNNQNITSFTLSKIYLDKIFNSSDLNGEQFFKEFKSNYNIDDATQTTRYVIKSDSQIYEINEPRGVRIIFIQGIQRNFYVLGITAGSTPKERKSNFD